MATAAERPTVLVVEDEFIIALDLSETVQDLGYEIEGPYAGNEQALEAIEDHLPDAAILDVRTADGDIGPVADRLAEAGVPIVFHSGHVAPSEMQERYPGAQACAKPCPPDKLIAAVQEAVARTHA